MSITKKQHYIPKFYIKNFSFDLKSIFELNHNKQSIYKNSIKNSMCENLTYEDEFLSPNSLERYFGSIEDKVSSSLRTIIAELKEDKSDISKIKNIIFNIMPELLIFYYRSGALLEEFSTGGNKDFRIDNLLKQIMDSNYLQELSSDIFACYKFSIIKCESEFLLSDQFISTAAMKIKDNFGDISNRHMGLQETLILIPISCDFYAVFWHTKSNFFLKDNEIKLLKNDEKYLMNKVILNNSYNKTVSFSEEVLSNIQKFYYKKNPAQMILGGDSFVQRFSMKKEVFFYEEDRIAFDYFFSRCMHLSPKYLKLKNSDKCLCNSDKKFKRCHKKSFDRVRIIWDNYYFNIKRNYEIIGMNQIERPITSFFVKK
jgi:hypothetical protein